MNNQPDACEIVLTSPDGEWLAQFTDALVASRLCAAAHQFPPITATYWWRGEMFRKTEHRPGVAILPFIGGHPSYLDWIVAETFPPDAP